MGDWTSEPWVVEREPKAEIFSAGGNMVGEAYGDDMPSRANARANARRIVACVNACKGIQTNVLEAFDGVLDVFSSLRERDERIRKLEEANEQKATALRAGMATVSGLCDALLGEEATHVIDAEAMRGFMIDARAALGEG